MNEGHPPDSTALDVEVAGYQTCPCGEWVLNEVAARTGGQCAACWAVDPHLGSVELLSRGRTIKVSLAKHKARKRELTEHRRERIRLNGRARDAARKRLAAIFPEVYEILLAEERGRLGLDPWPIEIAIRRQPDGTEADFAAVVAELDQAGVDTR